MVLAAAGGKSATPDHPMLDAARHLYEAAAEGVWRARATPRASRHHRHLLRAVEALGQAVSCTETHLPGRDADPILVPLRAAYASLQSASRALPGFRMIAFEQGCCAIHMDPGLVNKPLVNEEQ
jgi:hypothetical protein